MLIDVSGDVVTYESVMGFGLVWYIYIVQAGPTKVNSIWDRSFLDLQFKVNAHNEVQGEERDYFYTPAQAYIIRMRSVATLVASDIALRASHQAGKRIPLRLFRSLLVLALSASRRTPSIE